MKVKNIVELKSTFSFEAPLLRAEGVNISVNPNSQMFDLNSVLAPKPDDVFLVRVSGESMIDEGIYDGDILVVNKNERPKDGKVVIAALNGEMAVKTFRTIEGKTYLFSANSKFLPFEIMPFWQFEIQGIVKHVIHNV
ncbi:MAG: S24 family peptidase [Candidatus Kapabacteria bacterium]|jgi:DNA polymerase V|nr:S24 family peptidase [Candidatus Kapabacteria bacterium]